MRVEVFMAKRKRRKFTDEYKKEVVQLCRRGDRGVPDIARDLDIAESVVRSWLKQAEVDRGEGPDGALTTVEKEELRQLRREVRHLREEREILKKAAAFFAKESK
jgi:transposase